MSEPNTNPKPPLWKQLLGALTGATIAVVLYQAYTFTSSHLQAMNQSLRFGSWQASALDPIADDLVPAQHLAAAEVSSSVDVPLPPEELPDAQEPELEPQMLEFPPAVEEFTPEVVDLPPEEPLHEASDPIVAGIPEHSGQLPQSGFGLDLLAFTALGAVMGSRRMRRKRAQ